MTDVTESFSAGAILHSVTSRARPPITMLECEQVGRVRRTRRVAVCDRRSTGWKPVPRGMGILPISEYEIQKLQGARSPSAPLGFDLSKRSRVSAKPSYPCRSPRQTYGHSSAA
jgi:hypothetical protein